MSNKIEQLTCPRCQGSITLRAKGYSQTLVCQYCLTNLDISKSDLKINALNKQNFTVEPLIPLGARGKLHGVVWEVIGFMQKRGVFGNPKLPKAEPTRNWQTVAAGLLSDDDDDSYDSEPPPPIIWQEYLLFNPFKGFRWLSERNGHWNYIITLHDVPEKEFWGQNYNYLHVSYRMYESYEATVLYVIGEFYWRVKTGDYAIMTDYLNKESILTLEQAGLKPATVGKTAGVDSLLIGGWETKPTEKEKITAPSSESNQEQIWSLAEYIEPEEIQKAFNLEAPLPKRMGVALNQPLSHRDIIQTAYKISGLGAATLIVIQILFSLFSHPQIRYQSEIIATRPALTQANTLSNLPGSTSSTVTPPSELTNTHVSPPFTIDNTSGVMKLQIQAPVNQSWVEVDVSLIQETTGKHIDIDAGLAYYSGYDSDGYWSEGKKSDYWTFSVPEKGQYHLVISTDTSETSLPIKVTLSQGHLSLHNFLFSLILILLPGAFGLIYTLFFESRREQ